MYIILGGSRKPHYRRAETRRAMKHYLVPQLSTTDFLHYGADAMQQAWYLEHAALCPAYRNTETTYYPTGADFFPVFLRELAQAKEYIFLEYFIIAEGSMWSDVLDILTEKAAAGVEVRVIYDGVGSAPTLPSDYPQQLAQKGIRCQEFQPFRPLLSIHQNNRDHRKICVIDGVTGFVSGLNLADEYVDRKERFGYWKDNALRLRGEAVWSLAVFFLTMWNHQNPHTDFSPFRPKALPPVNTTGGIVVPYADTPDPADTVGADLHLQMITKAKRYLYLTTPYLVIDETITAALCTAARSGVDVRILTPHIPDKKVVFAVTQSNYPVLLEAGVRIYEFTPGFLHSKTVVADDLYASVGSCNLDYRSFYLQFENGATGVFITTTGDAPGTNRFEVTGTLGKLVCENDTLTFWELSQDEREFCRTATEGFAQPPCEKLTVETDGGKTPSMWGVLNAFAGNILHGTPLVAEGYEGIRGLTLSNAMHLSSWLGRPVDIPFDEELFLAELNKRRASSRKKEGKDITFSTEGTY